MNLLEAVVTPLLFVAFVMTFPRTVLAAVTIQTLLHVMPTPATWGRVELASLAGVFVMEIFNMWTPKRSKATP